MKQITKISMSLAFMFLIGIANVNAQRLISKISPKPVQKIPPRPGPEYIWVGPEWDEFKQAYTKGVWERPLGKDLIRVPGTWKKHPKGYEWIGGRYRKAGK